MINSDRLPAFNSEGEPTHWVAPARDYAGYEHKPTDDKERYSQEAVIENRKKSLDDYETESKGKSVKRHYIQKSAVTRTKVKTLLDRLDIPTSSDWLLFAGFTGELADVFSSELNGSVIFTDPLETWVENAADNGFKTDQCKMQNCSGDHFKHVDAVATFEGYEAISEDADLLYDGMRCLTTDYGFTFFQSEFTRNCTPSRGNGTSIKGRFKAFEKAYNVTSCYRENDGLRAYHVSVNSPETQARILSDYLTVYSTVDLYFSKADVITTNNGRIQITPDLISTISNRLQIPYQQAKTAYDRIEKVEYHMQNKTMKKYSYRNMLGLPIGNQVIMMDKQPENEAF